MSQFETQQSGGMTGFEGGPDELSDLLSKDISLAPAPIVESLTRAEMEGQIKAARAQPRSMKRFQDVAMAAVTLNEEVAGSCMYALPRGQNPDGTKKFITGPSIRIAEIVAMAWGNIRVECRVVEIGENSVVARGMCIDLEANNGQSVEVRRGILDKNGRRYKEDMIGVTCQAAISVARRNAIFAVVPRAFVEPLMSAARKVAVGDEKTLTVKRAASLDHFKKLGISPERVFAAVGVKGELDITLDHLHTLRGFATAIKTGEVGIDTVFPENGGGGGGGGNPGTADKLAALRTQTAPARTTPDATTGAVTAGAAQAATSTPAPTVSTGEQPSAASTAKPAQKAATANMDDAPWE